jgi:cytochrome P450 family 97 subfamily B polypeptide 3
MHMQARDYDNVKDPSLLRFLVDMRGADTEDKQLRDDLMTLLIAGHETTAAALTWGFYSLAQAPEALKELQDEVDRVVGDRRPTWDEIKQMPFLCNVRFAGKPLPC